MSHSLLLPQEALYLAIIKTHELLDALITSTLKEYGVSLSEYTLLRIIDNTPGVTASQAKDRLRITGASTSGIVSALEKKNLIVRTPDENDGRLLHLKLSKLGRAHLEKIGRSFSTIVQQSGLQADAILNITETLTSLSTSLSLYETAQ